jgi:hypothetical protein
MLINPRVVFTFTRQKGEVVPPWFADFNRVNVKYISHPSASTSPYFKSIKYFPALKVQNLQKVSISGWFGSSYVVTKKQDVKNLVAQYL